MSLYSARRCVLLALVALVCLVALASAQPCIRCEDCRGSNNCLKQCKRECPERVDLDKCKRAGQQAGRGVAREACRLTELFCRGGQQAATFRAAIRVDLKQCGNAAFGECVRVAKDRNQSPCGRSFNGVDQCNAQQFRSFYDGEVTERCNEEADKIEKNGP